MYPPILQVHRVWAARLVQALAAEAGKVKPTSNMTILENSTVTSITEHPTTVDARSPADAGTTGGGAARKAATVRLDSGLVIECDRVVHCTNGYASGLLPQLKEQSWLVPVRNQVGGCMLQPCMQVACSGCCSSGRSLVLIVSADEHVRTACKHNQKHARLVMCW